MDNRLGITVAVVAFSWKLKQKLLAIHRNVTLNKMNTKLLDDIDSPLCSLDQWNVRKFLFLVTKIVTINVLLFSRIIYSKNSFLCFW